jgi:hypothetical protein
MYWAIWDAVSGNAICDFDTEPEALAYVCRLIEQGWKPDELLLIFDDPSIPDEDVVPAVTGDELARRVGIADASPSRRTA